MQKIDLLQLHNKFSIFPANIDKSPACQWAKHRDVKIDFNELSGHNVFGCVAGFEGLEIIDIDNHFRDAANLYQMICDNVSEKIFNKLVIIATQSGGYHMYYKCDEIGGNQKLASRLVIENDLGKHLIDDNGKHSTKLPDGNTFNLRENKNTGDWECTIVLIETRGKGGYVICPPSKGYEVVKGDILNVQRFTKEERNELINVCEALHEIDENEKKETKQREATDDVMPGQKYIDDPASIQETRNILEKHGWSSKDGKIFTRPGKKKGISATFQKRGINKFYCFTSNGHPFDLSERVGSYTMFGVLAELEYGGDYGACAKELAKKYKISKPIQRTQQVDAPEENQRCSPKWAALFAIIKDWKLKFKYNELTKIIEYTKGDSELSQLGLLPNDIVSEMETSRGIKSISGNKVVEMISSTKISEVYNPIHEFLKGLPKWDGKDNIGEICKHIKLEDGEDSKFFESMLKKHLVRTIRCAGDKYYNNRMVLVFYGKQEIGKTLFFSWLCPRNLYYDESIDPSDKDSVLALARYLWINFDELDQLQKKDVARLKSFISKGAITKRVAYGRSDEQFERIASFVGSTNKTDILADDSNTRWIIVRVAGFNWQEYTKTINPLQIWAQALTMFKDDITIGELTAEEKQERERRNNSLFLETSPEREIIVKHFEEGDDKYTATDVKMLIEKYLMPTKVNMIQLVRELKRIYGSPIETSNDGKSGRYYNLKTSLGAANRYHGYHAEVEHVDKSDLPF